MSGFFGMVAKRDCVMDVFYGTDYHSHLGTKRAGMAFYNDQKGFQRAIHSLEDGYFRNKFDDDIKNFQGQIGFGVISDHEAQPILVTSHLGRFAVVTVSKINNIDELEKDFLARRCTFAESSQGAINPTEMIAKLIAECDDFVSGINNVFEKIKGSCSLLLLTENRIIAARDKVGRTPIVLGKRKDAYAATFETCAFPNLDFEVEHYLGPGEIIEFSAEGYKQLQAPGKELKICSFLWVYYGYPPSFYEGINVDDTRYRCGAAMAREEDVKADFVAAIPDSGVGHAMGYSNETGIPLKRPYSKYTPTWPRSFMPQNQETRELVARMKLIPNKAVIKGNSGVFIDDSIVRGTQLKDNVKDLQEGGIREMHMRIACPPLLFPCKYLNFSSSRAKLDLATRKAIFDLNGEEDPDYASYCDSRSPNYQRMVNKMGKNLGLTSLKFLKLEDMIKAIGLPKEKLCTHCWDNSGKDD